MSQKKSLFSSEGLEPFFDKISKLTKAQKIIICVATAVVFIGGFVYFSYMPKHEKINTLEQKHADLSKQLRELKKKAGKLSKLKKTMREVQARYDLAKQALPEGEEIPSLLTNISHAGQDAGLEFLLFKPGREKEVGFYAEIPISLEMEGRYHELALFFDKLTRLSRIVTIKEFEISQKKRGRRRPGQGEQPPDILHIKSTAETYKFLEVKEEKKAKKK